MFLLAASSQCGPDTVTAECAAQALAALCWNHPANQTLMGDSGGLAMLVDQLSLGPHSLLARGASLALAAAMGNNFRNQVCAPPNGTAACGVTAATVGGRRRTVAVVVVVVARAWCLTYNVPQHTMPVQNIVRDARGAYVLVGMLRSGPHNPVVVPTLHALALLVHGHRAAQSEVGEAGGCGALLRLLRGATQQEGDGGQEVVTEAMVALARLLADHPGNKAALLREGGLPDLLGVIRCGCQVRPQQLFSTSPDGELVAIVTRIESSYYYTVTTTNSLRRCTSSSFSTGFVLFYGVYGLRRGQQKHVTSTYTTLARRRLFASVLKEILPATGGRTSSLPR